MNSTKSSLLVLCSDLCLMGAGALIVGTAAFNRQLSATVCVCSIFVAMIFAACGHEFMRAAIAKDMADVTEEREQREQCERTTQASEPSDYTTCASYASQQATHDIHAAWLATRRPSRANQN